jgi:glycogen debranching enzyme
MTYIPDSPYLRMLRNHISLGKVPFSERGSRIMLSCNDSRFYVRLAERWAQWEDQLGHYRRRSPVIRDISLTDESGQPLEFEPVLYPHAVEMQTTIGMFRWTFADEETLHLSLPDHACGVRMQVYAQPGQTDRRGGEFKGDPAHRRTHRNIAYTTNARIVSNDIGEGENGYQHVALTMEPKPESGLLLNVTPRLGFNRAMPAASQALANAEKRWHAWFEAAPKVLPEYEPQYYYAWWCLRAGLLSPRFFTTRESMIPSKTWYVGIWHWDAFFHALAYRHVNMRLAEDQLRIMLDHQRADGMIPDAVHDEGVVFDFLLPGSDQKVEVTKPPLLAWAALKLYEMSGNLDFLQEIYEPLKRWNAWWFEKNDSDGDGIVQYDHPFSSGLDDSPLWDAGTPIESPDINTYLVMQLDALARIAELIGVPEDAPGWRAQAGALAEKMVEHFWDERAGLFWATKEHRPLHVETLFNLYPLLTGRVSRRVAERLVAHLRDPDEFWPTYPLPTVSIADPKFDANQMWRGPTWVNINYLFIEALVKNGYEDLARELRDRTMAVLMHLPDIYEYYNPLTGEAPPKAASIFGWSSAVFVDLAISATAGRII